MSTAKAKTPPAAKVKSTAASGTDFFERVERFLSEKQKLIFVVNLILTALFGLLLFDGRLSFATDDSTYIQNALALLEKGTYPSFQGALYPYFLALLIKLFGIRILLFKTFSLLFLIAHNYFLYKALQNRVPWLILFGGLFVGAVNAYILAYGSSTFSEAFYMMIQSLSLYVFFNLLDRVSSGNDLQLKETLKYWLAFGFVFFLLSISKNVAMFAILGVIVFFLFRKEWRNAIIAPVAFGIFKIPYELFVKYVWGKVGTSQAELMLRKDYNDPTKGTAELGDFFDRFFENFGNYVSTHIFKMLGLRGSGVPGIFTFDKIAELRDPSLKMEPSGFYGLLFLVLIGLALYFSFKKNKYIFYILLYVGTLLGITFFALHAFWNQDRLVVIYLPLIFIGISFGLYELIRSRNFSVFKPVLLIVMALVIIVQLLFTFKAVSKNAKQFKGYTKGNEYYGYPLPVTNYLKTCKWAGDNIKDTMAIACNKPVEGLVFGGVLKFTKLPQPPSADPDAILKLLKEKKIGYIIIDAFGADLSQVVQAIYQKYPEKIQQIHQEGEVEAAYLIKINY